jgi:hypothetical protein
MANTYDDPIQGLTREQIAQKAVAAVPIPQDGVKSLPTSTQYSTQTNIPVPNTAISPDILQPQTPLSVPSLQPTTPPPVLNQAEQLLKDTAVEDTETQKLGDSLSRSIYDLLPQLQGETKALADEQAKAGVTRYKQELNAINSQILAKEAEMNQDNINLIAQNRDIDRQTGMLASIVSGQQAKTIQDAQIIRALKSAEIGVLNARAIAKQGDINLAMDTAKQAVDVKFAPYKEALAVYQAQLEAIQPLLSKDEKKQAQAQQLKLDMAMKELDERKAKSKEIMSQVVASGLTQKFINRSGEFIRASDSKLYESPEEFFRDAGVKSFAEAYQRGLVGDLTMEKIADRDFVLKLRDKYPDAGINYNDDVNTARSKLQNSQTYYKENYIDDSFSLSPGEVRYDRYGNEIASRPPEAPKIDLNQMSDNERALMTQFTSNPIVKDFNEIQGNKLKIDNIVKNGVGGPADLAVIYSFMKSLDPSSVVRETEYASAAKSGNIFQGIYAKYNGYLKEKGGFLPASVKSEFQNLTNQAYQAKEQQYNNWREQIRRIAENQGLNPENVTPDFSSYLTNPNGQIIQYNGRMYQTDAQGNFDETQPIGQNPLDWNKAINSGGLSFNSVGNTSASNQVKGTTQNIGKMSMINPNTFKAIPQIVTQKFQAGATGGQCGDYVRKVTSSLGFTYPTLGDKLSQKIAAVRKYGTSLTQATIGSVIVTKENPTYGHVAYIIGRNAKGWIVSESNFKQSNKVSHGRVIPFNSPKIIGVINPTRRT